MTLHTVVAFNNNSPIRLSEVADVKNGITSANRRCNHQRCAWTTSNCRKQPEGNTLEVTRRIETALHELLPGLTGVDVDPTIFRPATFIERAVENLSHALLIGCGLVVVILVLFLFDWRTAVISLTAIPLSLISAVVILTWLGITLNTMVIAGLVIALGEVVDDAIIDVENIVRRLRLNAQLANPKSPFRVVVDASLEVRSAVVFATMIVIIVFPADFLSDWNRWRILPASGTCLHPGDSRFVNGGADRHTSLVLYAFGGRIAHAQTCCVHCSLTANLFMDTASFSPPPLLFARHHSVDVRFDRCHRQPIRLRVLARVPGNRFSDALHHQAGHIGGRNGPYDRARQQAAARYSRGEELRLAHRPS